MALEIERKFLVTNDDWRASCRKTEFLKDGLVAASADRKVRVRVCDGRATLTVKTKRVGSLRSEHEFEIPISEGNDLLDLCGVFRLEKRRHYIRDGGNDWIVDEYDGLLTGVTIAEVELPNENSEIELPRWVGREVTHDHEYGKIRMLLSRLAGPEPHRPAEHDVHKCALCYSNL
jgi:adenylate cyclase